MNAFGVIALNGLVRLNDGKILVVIRVGIQYIFIKRWIRRIKPFISAGGGPSSNSSGNGGLIGDE